MAKISEIITTVSPQKLQKNMTKENISRVKSSSFTIYTNNQQKKQRLHSKMMETEKTATPWIKQEKTDPCPIIFTADL